LKSRALAGPNAPDGPRRQSNPITLNNRPPVAHPSPESAPKWALTPVAATSAVIPNRKDIEQEFLRWRSPDRIAQDYKIPDHSSIYRHVHATGIFARRRKAVRAALEPIIECAEFVRVTASSLVKAIYAHTHINENGEWINHPTHHTVIVQHVNVPQENNRSDASGTASPVAAPPAAQPAAKDSSSPLRCFPESAAAGEGSALAIPLNSANAESRELNRQIQELEHAPTL
jgi:hypothetical protein